MVNGPRDYYRRLEGYLWRLLDGAEVLLPDGGDAPMRHVYGEDVARAVAAMLCDPRTFGQAYNLAQDEAPTLREVLEHLAAQVGAPAKLVPVSSEAVLAAGLTLKRVSPFSQRWMSFVDPSRAKRELGFAHTPLREYLDRVVAAFLAYPGSDRPDGYSDRRREVELARSVMRNG
jgi:nucleoside-diphosphate-sugar epimerase